MRVKILCTADVHLGRVSSRLPGDVTEHSARTAWERVVNLALRERVDVLAVAGDLIDAGNRYFEAFGPLEKNFRRLAAAGIETFIVAGNHDADSMPRFFDQFKNERVHFLGRGGHWESANFDRDGSTRLRIDGWSFPASQHRIDPLLDYVRRAEGFPVLGLLHADVDQMQSIYAPCRSADLLRDLNQLWLLGHVHSKREFRAPGSGALAFYPGSPQALDPGESGWHGVWIVDWEENAPPTLRPVGISSVRYDDLIVPLDGTEDETGVDAAIQARIFTKLDAIEQAGEAASLDLLSCRLRLTGLTRLHRQLAARDWSPWKQLRQNARGGGFDAVVESVAVETRLPNDLADLAQRNDPPGILAGLLIALGVPGNDNHPLLRTTLERLTIAFAAQRIDGDGEQSEGAVDQRRQSPDTERTRIFLLEQGHRLLGELLADTV